MYLLKKVWKDWGGTLKIIKLFINMIEICLVDNEKYHWKYLIGFWHAKLKIVACTSDSPKNFNTYLRIMTIVWKNKIEL